MNKIRKAWLWGLFSILIIIQFIPVDRSAPQTPPQEGFLALENPPENLAPLLKQACFDCHSYDTRYPWYAYVAPVSWWLNNHIQEGREHLNFSTWAGYDAEDREELWEEMAEEVEEGHMPLKSYTWVHKEARLSDEQRAALVEWFEQRADD